MPIFERQIQPNSFEPFTRFEETPPRAIIAADNGKTFFNTALEPPQGTFDMPAWADVPPGFKVGIFRSPILVGKTREIPLWDSPAFDQYFFVGIRPDAADSIVYKGRYESSLLPQGVGLVCDSQQTYIQVLRMDTPNKWFVLYDYEDHVWTIPNDVSRAALIEDMFSFYGTLALNDVLVELRVCAEDGTQDPAGRVLGSWLNGGFTPGPDGVSGGPLLPFYLNFQNVGGSTTVVGANHDLEVIISGPSDSVADCNWALFETSEQPRHHTSVVDASDITLDPGEEMSLYMANFSCESFGLLDPNYAARGVCKHFYLRQAPGELTPRTWAQAFALGPY